MQDDIKIEYISNTKGPEYMWWVQIYMTNKRGTKYTTMVARPDPVAPRYVHNVTNDRYCTMKNAPKWVKKTIEEQMPVIAIMLS